MIITVLKSHLVRIILVLGVFGSTAVMAAPLSDDDPKSAADTSQTASAEEFITLKVPLYSERFSEVPVAFVNEEPITLRELAAFNLAQKEQDEHDSAGVNKSGYGEMLKRLISSRLIVQEARNIGLDETDEYRIQVDSFTTNLLEKEVISRKLEGLAADPDKVRELYERISREVRLDTLTFKVGTDIQQFLDKVKAGDDFDELAKTFVTEGKAVLEVSEQYTKLKDLKPQVAQQAYEMAIGDVSNAYRAEDGFLVFRLADTRFVEDPSAQQEATKMVLNTLRKQKAMEYADELTDTYFTIAQDLYEQLDFNNDFEKLLKDDRPLAVSKDDGKTVITIADLAAKLKMEFFHGIDKAKNTQMIDTRKAVIFANMLLNDTAVWEARRLGLDQDEKVQKKVSEFERSTLFDSFMRKVIFPDVKLTADEVRSYYDDNQNEYSTPKLIKMKSIIFNNRNDAEISLERIKKGADFNWVSANATNFVSPDTKGVLSFDKNLLSLTALPEDLQSAVDQASTGSALLYAPSKGPYIYVLLIEQIFPPTPQPFDAVKDEVAKKVFNKKSQELLDDYVAKLMDAYDTRAFVVEGDNP